MIDITITSETVKSIIKPFSSKVPDNLFKVLAFFQWIIEFYCVCIAGDNKISVGTSRVESTTTAEVLCQSFA